MEQKRFRDRAEAGKQLARRLVGYAGPTSVVYALPRGGVVLGAAVARVLEAPLEILIARKVGHPSNPEYAVCAVTESGEPVCNPTEVPALDAIWLEAAISRERAEAVRRCERYLHGRLPISAAGKTAILVDDGIATGLTMRAAIREMRAQGAARVVVAVPVIPSDTAVVLAREADDVVAVEIPPFFLGAVGAYYDDFHQVTDEEVLALLHPDPPRLYHQPEYGALAHLLREAVPLDPGSWGMIRFANGELAIEVSEAPSHTCLVLTSLAPPDERLMQALLLCHTLHKDGAREITLLAPYLAYTRANRDELRLSRATAWVGALLQASGISRVVTIDVHGPQIAELYPMPLVSLSPARLFAEEILRFAWQDATVVAPDDGARERAEAVRITAAMPIPLAVMTKTRTADGITSDLRGQVGCRAVIVDDILDTGATLLACAHALRHAGVEEIMICVSHSLFTGSDWLRLWEHGVTHLICLDTVPAEAARLDDRIHILRGTRLLAEYLRA